MSGAMRDTVILDGEETFMAGWLPLPDAHPRICERHFDDIDFAGPDAVDFLLASDRARDCQCAWKIEDGRLYLVGIRGRLELREGDALLADWFSGVLRVPRGEPICQIGWHPPTRAEELNFEIESGVVVGTWVVDNRERLANLKIVLRKEPGCLKFEWPQRDKR